MNSLYVTNNRKKNKESTRIDIDCSQKDLILI